MQLKQLLFLSLLAASACQPETKTGQTGQPAPKMSGIEVDQTDNPEWRHENLRFYPVVADAAFVAAHAAVSEYIGLKDAMTMPKFRIIEKKPFGRFTDDGAVNALTVENRTSQPVFLMAGDVVKGGNQDRIIAENQVVPAVAIANIPVFCVEKGRWQYRDEDAEDATAKKVFAFKGYYNVAAGELRRTVKETQDQSEVWAKVGDITSANGASNGTSAYTGLEGSGAFVKARDQYLHYFEGKFSDMENVVGVIAVNGDHILGADVFAHPALFQKQFPALLHSYVTDAVTHENTGILSESKLNGWLYGFEHAWKKEGASSAKFYDNDQLIHFSYLSK